LSLSEPPGFRVSGNRLSRSLQLSGRALRQQPRPWPTPCGGADVADLTCGRCSAPLTRKPGPGRPPKYCGDCRVGPSWRSGVTDSLTHGRPSTYNRGCRCDLCRDAIREYGKRFRPPKDYVPVSCAFCGCEFKPTMNRQRFCRECSRSGKGKRKSPRLGTCGHVLDDFSLWGRHRECSDCRVLPPPKVLHGPPAPPAPVDHGPPAPKRCGFCRVWLVGSRKSDTCGKRCAANYRNNVDRWSDMEFGGCEECGVLFVRRAGRVGRCCSARCRKRAGKRDRKHRLRAAGPANLITVRKLAERDGWVCHICGKRVGKSYNPQHDRAPSIDHLVPVSAGGTHTWDNVALAHRQCNWERSNEGVAQLRLVG
jgi:hypothetical protein